MLKKKFVSLFNKNRFFKTRYKAPKEFLNKQDTYRASPQNFEIPQIKDFSLQNYNFEQFGDYTKTIQALLKQKVEIKTEKSKKKRALPPQEDFDISKYSAWRNFDRHFPKNQEHSMSIPCKIIAPPKRILQVFGQGVEAYRNGKNSTFEFDFEDNNFDQFLVYDYRSTTDYWGPNLSEEEYQKQKETLPPKKQKKKYPNKEEFWKSEELETFRVNCSRYADYKKFKKWFLYQLENYKDIQSYDEKISQKFGEIETFDNYEKNYKINKEMAVYKYSKEYFLNENEKLPKNIKFVEPLIIPEKLNEEFLLKN